MISPAGLSRQVLTWSALSLVVLACSSHGDIADLQGKIQAQTISVDDGSYSLSLTASPTISWTACSAGAPQLRILRLSDLVVLRDWQSATSGASITDLSLAVNSSYSAEVRCLGSENTVFGSGTGDGWKVVGPVSISPGASFSMISGESVGFSTLGGAPAFAFFDSGTGYMNSSSGSYSPPLGVGPLIDSVKVKDSLAQQSALTNISVRRFLPKLNLASATSGNNSISLNQIVEHSGLLIGAALVIPYTGFSGKPNYVAIYTSADNGTTWTLTSTDVGATKGLSINQPYLTSGGTQCL